MNKFTAINISSAVVMTLTLAVGVPMIALDRAAASSPEAQALITEEESFPALIDTREGTYIVYPSVLPECDEEDGTATTNSLPVAACTWDDGTGTPFIVIAP